MMTPSPMAQERTIVALDMADAHEALALCAQLRGACTWVKVGMELYYAAGPAIVATLKAQGWRVFLDLKLHDIPTTVYRAARTLATQGIDMFNVHAAGGTAMMRAASEGAHEGAQGATPPHVLAVTHLTSTSPAMLRTEIGIQQPLPDHVVQYATLAQQSGLYGVVCSVHEVPAIHRACGSSFATLTPGIRPQGAASHDQVRTATPRQAWDAGAQWIVIGRAITHAPDPRTALLQLYATDDVHPHA